ncbi:hypothetical protein BN1723_009976 [Verticillium longisporum]|uniref:Hypervirulence associated protein TUDOR domain-containing protein n=1 Tax=Verticillium longisporum TaxID=100787 RepID=A0A0G4KU76_VERLO|nr:hypothetical protein BN1723_009976 [Verticillium longisporum]
MVKPKEEVISEFNSLVNMTASDLETWLKSDDANSAGWPKDDADGDGETVGHESGRKIEAKGNEEKTDEEVKKTKSYASLKNWGHDFLKAEGRGGGIDSKKQDKKKNNKKEDDKKEDAEEDAEEEEDEEEGDDKEDGDAKAGDKRKKTSAQNGANKKRETRQGKGSSTNGNAQKNGEGKGDEENEEKEEGDEEYVEDEGDDDDNEEEDAGDDKKGKSNGGGKPKKGPKKGDTVSWNWGGGQPEGKVLDVKGEDTSITTKNGNQVTRKGDPEDPAVVIDAGKSKAIKSAHELN